MEDRIVGSSISDIQRRIQDTYKRIQSSKGIRDGMDIIAKMSNSGIRITHYDDIMDRDDWCDQITHLIHSVVILKDRIKIKITGRNDHRFNMSVDLSTELLICMDIDNEDKHGGIARQPYVINHPHIDRKNIKFAFPASKDGTCVLLKFPPGTTMNSPIDLDNIEYKHQEPNKVTISAPVIDDNGNILGDAFDIAMKAVNHLNQIIKDLNLDK
jgi:hypothetical protein